MKHSNRSFALIGVLFVLFFPLVVYAHPIYAHPSYAQFPGMDPSLNPMGMMRDTQFGPLMLLSRSEVQKELKLSKSQNEEIKKLQKEQTKFIAEQTKGARSGDATQMMEAMKLVQATQTEYNNKAKALLTDDQKQRFKEIRLQVTGYDALQDPEVQMALALTPEQKASISALNTEYAMVKMNSARNVYSAGSYKRKLEAVEKEFGAKFASVLTADQNLQLKKMQGEPFKDIKKITG